MLTSSEPEIKAIRQEPYRRNPKLEKMLAELNDFLNPAEEQLAEKYSDPDKAVIFIVGPPRSGSTLILQWLASSGRFGYITNFNSRFFKAPVLGAMIQQMILDPDYAFSNELKLMKQQIPFKSDLGKTEGIFSPNEFWYFWRRFFPWDETSTLNMMKEPRITDIKFFKKELAALVTVFKKPLVLKAMNMNWNLNFLVEKVSTAKLIYLTRHPFFNIRSLLKARRKFFGTENEWYSFKPPEYKELCYLDPYKQVAGQVYYTNQAILEQLKQIDPARYIKVDYESFCRNPVRTWKQVASLANLNSNQRYTGVQCFESTNRFPGEDSREDEAIIHAYYDMFGEDISPQTNDSE